MATRSRRIIDAISSNPMSSKHGFQGLLSHEVPIGTLVVHLISQEEYESVKTDEGLDRFLDLLDEKDYLYIFDPKDPLHQSVADGVTLPPKTVSLAE